MYIILISSLREKAILYKVVFFYINDSKQNVLNVLIKFVK